MKLKEFAVTSILLLSSSPVGEYNYIKDTKENIIKALLEKQQEETEKGTLHNFDVSEQLLHGLDTIDFEHKPNVVFSRKLADIKKTPLFMRGTKRHIGEFLGYNQYDSILQKYDKDTLDAKESKAITNIDRDQISFPLIYDGLKEKIPAHLDQLLSQEKFEKYRYQIGGQDTIIIVSKQEDGKHAIAYYLGGKLFLASYISLGLSHYTPQGLFTIQEKISQKKSTKYNNAAMPYAIHIHGNIFIHQGTANGQKKSHGCVRVPGLYQEVLYHHVKRGTKVLILP